jgi:hypothetical protein
MFAVAHLLNDEQLRQTGWAQVDFTFGVNPLGAHLSNKSDERVRINGYWEGVEVGWPQAYGHGYGQLSLVRGTLDGSPLDHHFPRAAAVNISKDAASSDAIGKDSYSTEGWCISNRGWMATITFSTLGSHRLRILDQAGQKITNAKAGQTITVELRAALNQDRNAKDKGWVEIRSGKEQVRVEVAETAVNSGLFTGKYMIPKSGNIKAITAGYGYLGFRKEAGISVAK